MKHYNFYALYDSGLTLIGGGDYESDKEAVWQADAYVKPVDVVEREEANGQKFVVWTVNSGKISRS